MLTRMENQIGDRLSQAVQQSRAKRDWPGSHDHTIVIPDQVRDDNGGLRQQRGKPVEFGVLNRPVRRNLVVLLDA